MHEFTLVDGTVIGNIDPRLDPPGHLVNSRQTKLNRLALGEQFAYVFDGDTSDQD